jgi:hypothetical protein
MVLSAAEKNIDATDSLAILSRNQMPIKGLRPDQEIGMTVKALLTNPSELGIF